MSYVKKLLVVGAFVAAAAAATQSQAATYLLTTGQFGAGDFGSVNVAQDGTDQLKFVVTLASGYGFVDTGGHEAFTFALSGAPALTSTLPSGFSLTENANAIDNAPFKANGHSGTFGFDYELDCSTVCTQGSGGYGVLNTSGDKTLTFDVKAPGLVESMVDFANTNSYGHVYFSADVIGKNGTGVVGSLGSTVPEPAAWAMMGLGVFAAGAMLRRRRQAGIQPVAA